jgi:signal transduction histidine kinase/ActR/RegA family two-component response regulator
VKFFQPSETDVKPPILDILAHRELALRSPKVALSLVPVAVLVAFMTDLKDSYPLQSAAAAVVFLAAGIFRLVLSRRFSTHYRANSRSWFRNFALAILLSTSVFSVTLPLIYLKLGAGWTFIICLLTSTGAAASATGSLSPHQNLFRAYVVLAKLPAIVTLLAFGGPREMGLGLLTLVFLVQILVLGQHSHKQFWAGLRSEHLLKQRAKALEKAHAEVQAANKTKDEFLANMSHEVRTPLNGILGLTDLILETELQPRQKDYLEDVRVSGQNLLNVINEVLDFSILESGKMELENSVFSLPDLLRKVAVSGELGCKANGNTLTLQLADDMPTKIVGDQRHLHQILTHLVDNAVKFTKLGSITLKGTLDHRQDGLVAFTISVQDSGPGIAPEDHKNIFQAFKQVDGSSTRTYGGTGLGLAVCHGLANLMGGRITLESTLGQGSTFSLHLALPEAKIEKPAEVPGKAAGAEPSDALSGLVVLLVEDNTVNAKLASRLLEKSGLTVIWAHNGQEGVTRYLKGGIDLVLMDIQMPVLDGFGATEAIRQAEKAEGQARVPIIALTAHAMKGYREKCLEAEMDDYLTKPLQPKLLRETLARWSPKAVS